MNCKPKCWKIVVLVLVGIAALGWVVMALWNWLLPNLFFGVKEIDYVQAMGVLLLSKILFGGFRGHCGGPHKWHQHRLENMTPEEREKFQSGMRGWCGRGKSVETESKE
jgi:hypothetical protein